MSSRIAFPFLTLGDHAVRAGPWLLQLNEGDRLPAGDYLKDWDCASQVSMQRTITIDRDLASADLNIEKGHLRLALCVRVGTGAGRLPRSIILQQRVAFEDGADTLAVEFDIPGVGLSSVLDLMTEIILDERPEEAGALAPTRPCERVWHESHRVRLEGEEPRFPIEVADLGSLLADGVAVSAPWYVHWSPRDWSRDFHGSIRLYLNKNQPAFIERVQGGDRETLRAIMADVMGQVVEHFLSLDDCEDLAVGFEPGSLGSQAVSWINLAWPARDLAFVKALFKSRPGTFRAAMHALAEQRGPEE